MNYTTIPATNVVARTAEGLKTRNFEAIILNTKEEALEKIKELIPEGASVMNGSSVTLHEIGFVDYLKSGEHKWNNLHEKIVNEKDPVKAAELRQQAIVSDYYLGSVHALSEEGELVIASNSGSQLPHVVFTSPNVILVVGTQKITPKLVDAINRLEQFVVPLEDKRLMGVYGAHTTHSKTLIYNKEAATSTRKIRIILVNEKLGY